MGPNVLMTVRGRKSGRDYTFPVATLEASGREFLFSPFGEVNWVANLRASGEATLRRGRRNRRMSAVELTPEVAAPFLAEGMRPVIGMPMFGSMIAGWYGIERSSTPEDYLAAARLHPAFELREIGS
jgi:deazaflavin-dependent oxidoreductase (nitroreductase family)